MAYLKQLRQLNDKISCFLMKVGTSQLHQFHQFLPIVVLNLGPSASLGTGMMISTLFDIVGRMNERFMISKAQNVFWIWVAFGWS